MLSFISRFRDMPLSSVCLGSSSQKWFSEAWNSPHLTEFCFCMRLPVSLPLQLKDSRQPAAGLSFGGEFAARLSRQLCMLQGRRACLVMNSQTTPRRLCGALGKTHFVRISANTLRSWLLLSTWVSSTWHASDVTIAVWNSQVMCALPPTPLTTSSLAAQRIFLWRELRDQQLNSIATQMNVLHPLCVGRLFSLHSEQISGKSFSRILSRHTSGVSSHPGAGSADHRVTRPSECPCLEDAGALSHVRRARVGPCPLAHE